MCIAFYSCSSYPLEILFTTTPGITPLACQPAWPMAGPWQAGRRVLTNTTSLGTGNMTSFNAQLVNPSIGMIEKYHKCFFPFSPLMKRMGSLCNLFNYMLSFPKHFIFWASSWTDRSHWPLHLSST